MTLGRYLQPSPALEDLDHLVREDAVQGIVAADIRVLAKQQNSAAVGVGVHGVDDLQPWKGVEMVAVSDRAEDLDGLAVDVEPCHQGDEIVGWLATDRLGVRRRSFHSRAGNARWRQLGGEHQRGRVAEVEIESPYIV